MKHARWRGLISRVLLVVGFFLSSFWLSAAVAEQYRTVKGKSVPVCQLCKENLELFDSGPNRCEREYSSQFPELKPLEWTKLEVLTHKELVKKIGRFAYSGNQDTGKTSWGSTDVEFEETLHDYLRRGNLGLSTTEVDIDNDGQPEIVLRYEIGQCPFSSQQLFVLTPDRSSLDIRKTNPLLGWGWGMSVGVFLHKNITYVDVWADLEQRLSIHKYANEKEQELCRYTYRGNPKASNSQR